MFFKIDHGFYTTFFNRLSGPGNFWLQFLRLMLRMAPISGPRVFDSASTYRNNQNVGA